jgi:voltage-gated potassium channel
MQKPCFHVSQRKIRSAFLLAALLALIVSAFILPTAPGSAAAKVMAVVYLVVFSIACYLIGARHKWLVAYWLLAACIWIIGFTCELLTDSPPVLLITRDGLIVLLQLMLVYLVSRFSMFDPHASRADRIVAGISGYLIIALLWAGLYALHERIWPGGLVDSTNDVMSGAEGDYLYYSFITLTTTGYGEILPISPSARLLASLQAVTGTLYLAVFIAALLGRPSNESADSEDRASGP